MHSRHVIRRTNQVAAPTRRRCWVGPARRLLIRLLATGYLLVASFPFAIAAEQGSAIGIVSRIQRQPVESRALAAVGYSRRLRALEVEFRRGGTYRYLDVPAAVYRDLLGADSKAGFYNRNIRGKYRSVYVRPRRKQ